MSPAAEAPAGAAPVLRWDLVGGGQGWVEEPPADWVPWLDGVLKGLLDQLNGWRDAEGAEGEAACLRAVVWAQLRLEGLGEIDLRGDACGVDPRGRPHYAYDVVLPAGPPPAPTRLPRGPATWVWSVKADELQRWAVAGPSVGCHLLWPPLPAGVRPPAGFALAAWGPTAPQDPAWQVVGGGGAEAALPASAPVESGAVGLAAASHPAPAGSPAPTSSPTTSPAPTSSPTTSPAAGAELPSAGPPAPRLDERGPPLRAPGGRSGERPPLLRAEPAPAAPGELRDRPDRGDRYGQPQAPVRPGRRLPPWLVPLLAVALFPLAGGLILGAAHLWRERAPTGWSLPSGPSVAAEVAGLRSRAEARARELRAEAAAWVAGEAAPPTLPTPPAPAPTPAPGVAPTAAPTPAAPTPAAPTSPGTAPAATDRPAAREEVSPQGSPRPQPRPAGVPAPGDGVVGALEAGGAEAKTPVAGPRVPAGGLDLDGALNDEDRTTGDGLPGYPAPKADPDPAQPALPDEPDPDEPDPDPDPDDPDPADPDPAGRDPEGWDLDSPDPDRSPAAAPDPAGPDPDPRTASAGDLREEG